MLVLVCNSLHISVLGVFVDYLTSIWNLQLNNGSERLTERYCKAGMSLVGFPSPFKRRATVYKPNYFYHRQQSSTLSGVTDK